MQIHSLRHKNEKEQPRLVTARHSQQIRSDWKIKSLTDLLHKLVIAQKRSTCMLKSRHLKYSRIHYTTGEADKSTFTELWTKIVHRKATRRNIYIYI